MPKWTKEFIERGDNSTFEISCNEKPVLFLWNSALDERELFEYAAELTAMLNLAKVYAKDPSKKS